VYTRFVTKPPSFTHLFLKLLINSDDGLKKVALPCIHPSAVGSRGATACSPLGRTGCARWPAIVSAVPASAQLECSASSNASRTQRRTACQRLQPYLSAAASRLGGLCSFICTISGRADWVPTSSDCSKQTRCLRLSGCRCCSSYVHQKS